MDMSVSFLLLGIKLAQCGKAGHLKLVGSCDLVGVIAVPFSVTFFSSKIL